MSNPRRTRSHLLIVAACLGVAPLFALGQGQVDTSRTNDANNRVGSGGRNNQNINPAYYNPVINTGNRVVTGNVTLGREFRDNVGYGDPFAFRGPTAGQTSDNFIKNSTGVPQGSSEPVPNRSTAFYGASQTVAPPPGYQLTPNKGGYVPPPPGTPVRGAQDQRLGVVDLNTPIAAMPAPGEMITRGSLNPQQAAQQAGVLTGSTLYGVREWNPADPADRVFLENLASRQNGGLNRAQLDPREVQRMREELERALSPDQQQQQQPNEGAKPITPGNVTGQPLGKSFDTAVDPTIANAPIKDQVTNRPLTAGLNTDQGMRFNLLGNARRTSTQYTELSKRLEQYYADRPKTDADAARTFNAELKAQATAKAAADAKVAAANATKNGGNTVNPVKPDPTKPDENPTKPKVKKPTPVKIDTLAMGVKGEGLGNVLKKAEGLMKEGKFASALDEYDAAEAVTPNNPLIWVGRAHAELGAGFFMRADSHLRQALTTDKALLMGQFDLTGMLGEERLTKVVNELKDIANKDTKPAAVFLLAYVAYNTGHERQALGYLDLAEKRAGNDTAFYRMLKDHWALPDADPKGDAAKPELNK